MWLESQPAHREHQLRPRELQRPVAQCVDWIEALRGGGVESNDHAALTRGELALQHDELQLKTAPDEANNPFVGVVGVALDLLDEVGGHFALLPGRVAHDPPLLRIVQDVELLPLGLELLHLGRVGLLHLEQLLLLHALVLLQLRKNDHTIDDHMYGNDHVY